MAAYAALVSLLNNIHAITNHPTLSTSLDNKHIQPLLEKTNFLLDFIEGNNYGGGSEEAQDLERKIASAAHAAEDLIESHIVDQIHIVDRIQEANRIWSDSLKSLLKLVGFHRSDGSEKSLDLQQINEDMDAIMKEANGFKERHQLGEEQQPARLAGPLMQSGESTTGMVGLDVELNQLLDELTGYQSSRRIISIVGMGGTGKTTLAKNVYEHLLIKEKFQFRAWAAISQQSNPKEVVSKLLPKLLSNLEEFRSATIDDIGLQLHRKLLGRRYLIVLDDIWSVTAWDEVKRFFPDNNNGSRILITTRLSNVAEDCGSSCSSVFKINLLDEGNSWKLFCEKTFQGEECPPELQEVGEEIVALCKGLALSIVVIGGILLKSPRILGYWMSVAKDLKSITNSKEKQQSLDVLSLSYNHLPPHLKPCFLYMGVFREDSKIRVSKIIHLWIAEGFIKSSESQDLEEIAEAYVNDLIDRNLVLVGKRRKNGKVGSCGIHDLLRNLCIKLAEQQELFHLSESEIRGTERRLVYNTHERARIPLIRSIIAWSNINEIIEYRLLRVLNEHGHHFDKGYYQNVNLRYLSHNPVDWYPWKLPTSVSRIWNLQTLIINQSYGVVVVPTEFWKMRQLRHVHCRKIYIPGPPPSNGQERLLILENLQTLKRVMNLRLSEEVCNIISNIKKLHLSYDTVVQGYDDSLVESLCNLVRLHKLKSLRINTVLVRDLVPYKEKLRTSFPRSLKMLSLRRCGLHWDDMAIIGLLPRLELLLLDVCEGIQWSPVDGQFFRLKYLKIQYCKLECWEAEASHFPVLEKLFLYVLHKLEEIPLSIGDIPTLELIRVEYCSESAAISAVKIKEDQIENGGQLQVQVCMRDLEEESFKQKLETEELTTNNIQLEIKK